MDGIRTPTRGLRAVATACLRATNNLRSELSIALCGDERIRGLNRHWRQKDSPTDVLSFAMEAVPGRGPRTLGDVVISVETAARQAAERGHSLEVELAVLLVHGLCHLLGHDHEGEADNAAMAAEEARLLAAAGIGSSGLVARASG
jgi:probable rRNA maturation factor